MLKRLKLYRAELLVSCACLALGMASGYTGSAGEPTWYANLVKPSFNPPNWVFAPVWTVLYLMLGIALVKLWQQRLTHPWPLRLFIFQFACNLLWTPLFFYYQRIDLALLNIILLWSTLLLLLWQVRKNTLILGLLLPYTLWISFALSLTLAIYNLN